MKDAGIYYPYPLCLPSLHTHTHTHHIHTWQLNPEMPFQAMLFLCYASSMVWCTWNCQCFLSIITYFAKHCTLQQSARDHALRSARVALCEDNHNQSFAVLIWLILSSLHAALKSRLLKVSTFTWKLSEHFHFNSPVKGTQHWNSSFRNLLTVGIPA